MNHIDRFGDGLKLSPNFWETKLDGIQGYNDGGFTNHKSGWKRLYLHGMGYGDCRVPEEYRDETMNVVTQIDNGELPQQKH